jgi:hypothetical protein
LRKRCQHICAAWPWRRARVGRRSWRGRRGWPGTSRRTRTPEFYWGNLQVGVNNAENLHELALVLPLYPHAKAVLNERGDEEETGQVGQQLLGVSQDLDWCEIFLRKSSFWWFLFLSYTVYSHCKNMYIGGIGNDIMGCIGTRRSRETWFLIPITYFCKNGMVN